MRSSEVEDRVWPDPITPTEPPGEAWTSGVAVKPRSALWWGLSLAIHLVLLVAVGIVSHDLSEAPQTPPLRVSFAPTMETSARPLPVGDADSLPQSLLPERQALENVAVPPVTPSEPDLIPTVVPQPPSLMQTEPERTVTLVPPEPTAPELIEVTPEVAAVREPPPTIEPSKPVRPDLVTPGPKPSKLSPAPSPPVVPRSPTARAPQTTPTRKLPRPRRPATTFDDAVVARPPAGGPNQREGSTTTPGPPPREQAPPQASQPRSTGVRYGQNPAPAYPSEARRRGWEGTVLLMVEVLENGRPDRVTIKESSGHTVLDEAASGAVRRWMFVPAHQNGIPVRSVAEVPIVFSLLNRR